MKTLRILTIIAIAGTTSLVAGGGNHAEQDNCTNQYTITIGDQHTGKKMHKRQHRKNQGQRLNRLLRKLDLSETQKRQLKEIRKEMRQAKVMQREQHKGAATLKKYLSVDGFDREGFAQAATERSKTMAQARAAMMEKYISVLTPEQRIMLIERLEKRGKGKKHQRK